MVTLNHPSHPNVARFIACSNRDGDPAIFMECAETTCINIWNIVPKCRQPNALVCSKTYKRRRMLLGTVVHSKLVTMPENKTKRTWKVFHSVYKSVKTLTPSYSYFQQLHVRGFFSRRDAHFPPEYPGLD